jgi:GTP-binding protein
MIQTSQNSVRYIQSAGTYEELPPVSLLDEYCLLGRSNVGKSSFINHVLESGAIARVSKTPGKTNCANYYQVDDGMFWVDLPGYGYARTSQGEKRRWTKLISDYCEKRASLCGVLWLVDSRHIGVKADIEALSWLAGLGLPILPILTKMDKLVQRELVTLVSDFRKRFVCDTAAIPYSVKTHVSRERFWNAFSAWRKNTRRRALWIE